MREPLQFGCNAFKRLIKTNAVITVDDDILVLVIRLERKFETVIIESSGWLSAS